MSNPCNQCNCQDFKMDYDNTKFPPLPLKDCAFGHKTRDECNCVEPPTAPKCECGHYERQHC